mmetsp:Transcript_43532/g.57623  ORF Transcript_43532/g.57623 Transcript_43532/m.57623 type:complete len:128 (+) Transcript_43532:41-424(+)
MLGCDKPGVDPDNCVAVCDPVFEDCVIERPSGPSYEDAKVVGVFFASEMQVFLANLQVLISVMMYIFFEYNIAYRLNESAVYKQMQTDFFLMADSTEWWPQANTIRRSGGLSIMALALFTQSLSLYG